MKYLIPKMRICLEHARRTRCSHPSCNYPHISWRDYINGIERGLVQSQPRIIYFIDGENARESMGQLTRLTPWPLGVVVLSFMAARTYYDQMYDNVPSNIHLLPTIGDAKDAADASMCRTAGRLDTLINPHSLFVFVSADKFISELALEINQYRPTYHLIPGLSHLGLAVIRDCGADSSHYSSADGYFEAYWRIRTMVATGPVTPQVLGETASSIVKASCISSAIGGVKKLLHLLKKDLGAEGIVITLAETDLPRTIKVTGPSGRLVTLLTKIDGGYAIPAGTELSIDYGLTVTHWHNPTIFEVKRASGFDSIRRVWVLQRDLALSRTDVAKLRETGCTFS